MGEAKQPHLNGAYYGPSIPPPSKTYHRHGRGDGCNPFSCCCGCLCSCIFNCIFQIILTVVITIGVILLVLWLVLRPNRVRFHVTDAVLTEFNYSTANNNLYYNLALNMTIRNPNRRIGIYYDSIEARASYEGQRFVSTQLTRFYQGHRNTTSLSTVFRGQNMVMLSDSGISRYNEERSSGRYRIDVRLYLRIRLRTGLIRSPRFRPRIECDLRVPLDSNGGSSSGAFETTRCGLDW